MTAWWLLVLAGSSLGGLWIRHETPLAPTTLSLAFDAVAIAAAILAILVVRRITDLQRRAAGGGDSVPAAAVLST